MTDPLIAHLAAGRPARGEDTCVCCKGNGDHNGTPCQVCDDGIAPYGQLNYCPGFEPRRETHRRRHWRQGAADPQAEMVRTDKLMRHREWHHGPGWSKSPEGEQMAPRHSPGEWADLAADVKASGIREPIHMHWDPKSNYAYIAEGNSRLAWAHAAGQEYVPVIGHRRSWIPDRRAYKLPGPSRAAELKERSGGHIGADLKPSDFLPDDYMHPGFRHQAAGDYRMQHQGPDEDSGEALHEIGTGDIYPSDVHQHPDWYGAEHEETRTKLHRNAGRPYSRVSIYRSLPSPHRSINTGDWVATAAAYARDHGRETDPKDDWPVVKATVRADQIRNDGNSLEEWSYHGPPIHRAVLHFGGGENHRGKSGRGRTDSETGQHEPEEMGRHYSEMLSRAREQKKAHTEKVDAWNRGEGPHPGQFRFQADARDLSEERAAWEGTAPAPLVREEEPQADLIHHPPGHQAGKLVDVYHGTNGSTVQQMLRGPVSGGKLYVSSVPHSRYMARTGPVRMHLRVPEELLHPDENEEFERANHYYGFAPGERHYVLHADDVRPFYQGHRRFRSTNPEFNPEMPEDTGTQWHREGAQRYELKPDEFCHGAKAAAAFTGNEAGGEINTVNADEPSFAAGPALTHQSALALDPLIAAFTVYADSIHPDLHRGIATRLDPGDHAIVSDTSRHIADRAQHLLDAVTRGGNEPLGQHWSTDEKEAQGFTRYNSPGGSDERGPAYDVVFHARHPGMRHVITDPYWREEHEVNESEDEHPLERHTKLQLNGISWRQRGLTNEWTKHRFREPQYHQAARWPYGQEHTAAQDPDAECPSCGRGARDSEPLRFTIRGRSYPSHLVSCKGCDEVYDASKSGAQSRVDREVAEMAYRHHTEQQKHEHDLAEKVTGKDTRPQFGWHEAPEELSRKSNEDRYTVFGIPASQTRGTGKESYEHRMKKLPAMPAYDPGQIPPHMSALHPRDELPPDPGTQPIPEGHVRLWHYTPLGNADSIREHGLLRSKARGDSGTGDLSEPSAGVWASTRRPDEILDNHSAGAAVVEFHAHPGEISGNAESPWQAQRKDRSYDPQQLKDWAGGYHHVIMHGDVKPHQILSVHEPWHGAARYMRNDDPSLKSYQWIKDEDDSRQNEHLQPYKRGLHALERPDFGHHEASASLENMRGRGYNTEGWSEWQQGRCGTYACALMRMNPRLRFGTAGTEDFPDSHFFAHDDTHAYDSAGRHPLPYHGVHGDLTQSDLDQDAEYFGLPDDEAGPEGGEHHIRRAMQHAREHGILEGRFGHHEAVLGMSAADRDLMRRHRIISHELPEDDLDMLESFIPELDKKIRVPYHEILHTGQRDLHAPALEHYRSGGGNLQPGISGEGEPLPTVVSLRGRKWITDGHHRAVVSRENREHSFEAWHVDGDEDVRNSILYGLEPSADSKILRRRWGAGSHQAINQEGGELPQIPSSKFPPIDIPKRDHGNDMLRWLNDISSTPQEERQGSDYQVPHIQRLHEVVRGYDTERLRDIPKHIQDAEDYKQKRYSEGTDIEPRGEGWKVFGPGDAQGIADALRSDTQSHINEREHGHLIPDDPHGVQPRGRTPQEMLRNKWHFSGDPTRQMTPEGRQRSRDSTRKLWTRMVGQPACEHGSCPPWQHEAKLDREFIKSLEFTEDDRVSPLSGPWTRLRAHHPEHGHAGDLDYAKHGDPENPTHLAVSGITTERAHERKGVASALMKELERRYPDVPIDHGRRSYKGMLWANRYYKSPKYRLSPDHPDDYPGGWTLNRKKITSDEAKRLIAERSGQRLGRLDPLIAAFMSMEELGGCHAVHEASASQYVFTHDVHYPYGPGNVPEKWEHEITARTPEGELAGKLRWKMKNGRTTAIVVAPSHQRRGLATAMWEEGAKYDPPPRHSYERTDEGDKWARAMKGTRPRTQRTLPERAPVLRECPSGTHEQLHHPGALHEAMATEAAFYHGDTRAFGEGDEITPESSQNEYWPDELGEPEGAKVKRVFFSEDPQTAHAYGMGWKEPGGGVYRVEPTGPYHPHRWESGTLVSAHPLRVVEQTERHASLDPLIAALGIDDSGHIVEDRDDGNGFQHLDGSCSEPDGSVVTDHPVYDAWHRHVIRASREEKGDRWHEYRSRYLPDTLHRGVHAQLDPDVHDYVHDESVPREDRARVLLDNAHRLGLTGLGQHWTPHISVAHRAIGNAADEFPGAGGTDVIFHAHAPGRRNEIRDPAERERQGVGWQYSRDEDETFLREGAPLRLQGISWKLHEPGYPNEAYEHHDFPKAIRHTAEREWDSPEHQEMLAHMTSVHHYPGAEWRSPGQLEEQHERDHLASPELQTESGIELHGHDDDWEAAHSGWEHGHDVSHQEAGEWHPGLIASRHDEPWMPQPSDEQLSEHLRLRHGMDPETQLHGDARHWGRWHQSEHRYSTAQNHQHAHLSGAPAEDLFPAAHDIPEDASDVMGISGGHRTYPHKRGQPIQTSPYLPPDPNAHLSSLDPLVAHFVTAVPHPREEDLTEGDLDWLRKQGVRYVAPYKGRKDWPLYRGIDLELPPELHRQVHDESLPVTQRARLLAAHVAPLHHGMHWTHNHETAGVFSTAAEPEQTRVVLRAEHPGYGAIERSDAELDRRGVNRHKTVQDREEDYEAEVPLKARTPLKLTGIGWAPGGPGAAMLSDIGMRHWVGFRKPEHGGDYEMGTRDLYPDQDLKLADRGPADHIQTQASRPHHFASRREAGHAFPNIYHGDPEFGGNPEFSHTWFHGTRGEPEFGERRGHGGLERAKLPPEERMKGSGWPQPNQMMGIHLSPLHEVGHKFASSLSDSGSAIVHARLNFHNPAHFPTERHLNYAVAHWASQHYPHWHDEKVNGQMGWNYSDREGTRRDFSHVPEGYGDRAQDILQWHPHLPEIIRGFHQHLRDTGHHGITYGNMVEGPYSADATRGGEAGTKYITKTKNWPGDSPRHISAIAQPEDIQATHVEHISGWKKEPEPHEHTWEQASEHDEPDEMRDKVLAFHREHGGAYPASHQHTAAWQPSSGIFAPTTGLDPLLFESDGHLRSEARQEILDKVADALQHEGYVTTGLVPPWLRAYLAGGSASEWAGGRPNENARDLDVLIGLDYRRLREQLPVLPAGLPGAGAGVGPDFSDADLERHLNNALRQHFNDESWRPAFGGHWSLTGYVNPHAWDISVLRPYAAYDLTNDRWAVRPPHSPGHAPDLGYDPGPQARAIASEIRAIMHLPEPHRSHEARSIWDRIHADRSRAFSAEGQGYTDPGNTIEKWLAYMPSRPLDKLRQVIFDKAA